MLKKRGIIGIGIPLLVFSVIVGIASLPDEVLLESSTNENSQILSEDIQYVPTIEDVPDIVLESVPEKNMDNTDVELTTLKKELDQLKKEIKQLKTNSNIPEEISEISETENEELENQTEGKVIRINLRDGVGALEK